MITISFDMDGTINNMYSLPQWVENINSGVLDPYVQAPTAFNFAIFARVLNQLQEKGYRLQIITWLSKNGTAPYNKAVAKAKRQWLQRHLPSVVWDNIVIIEYGTPKENYCNSTSDIIFDDNAKVRKSWTGKAFDEKNILENLKKLLDK